MRSLSNRGAIEQIHQDPKFTKTQIKPMAKFTDLDPNHKSTLAITLTAITMSAKLLHADSTGKLVLPKGLTLDQWADMIYLKALEHFKSSGDSIEGICQTADDAVANHPNGAELEVVKGNTKYAFTNPNLN